MKIVVSKNNNIIIAHGDSIYYVNVENEEYVKCTEEYATGILVLEQNTIYPPSDFYICETDHSNIIDEYYEYINGVVQLSVSAIANLKAEKLNKLSETCEEIIVNGVGVETSNGIEHFSLTVYDQLDIKAQLDAVKSGTKQVRYHADDGIFRWFSAEEMTNIATETDYHIAYNKTYFNHIKNHVLRLDNIDDINSVYWGMPLPDDLDANFISLMGVSTQSQL